MKNNNCKHTHTHGSKQGKHEAKKHIQNITHMLSMIETIWNAMSVYLNVCTRNELIAHLKTMWFMYTSHWNISNISIIDYDYGRCDFDGSRVHLPFCTHISRIFTRGSIFFVCLCGQWCGVVFCCLSKMFKWILRHSDEWECELNEWSEWKR